MNIQSNYTIGRHTVTYHSQMLFAYDKKRLAEVDAAVAAGALRIIDGHPVPVIALNKATQTLDQYLTGHLSIDGQRLGQDVAFVEISAWVRTYTNGAASQWAVSATFVDVFVNGRGNGRTLYEHTHNGVPTTEGVETAMGEVAALLGTFDYTSEWVLDELRSNQFHALIGEFPCHPSREEYEAKCNSHGLQPRPDGSMNYAAEYYDYGVGGFSKLTPEQQLEMEIALRRGRAYLAELQRDTRPIERCPVSDRRPVLTCKRCPNTGRAGAYPFSTLPSSGLCDDCV